MKRKFIVVISIMLCVACFITGCESSVGYFTLLSDLFTVTNAEYKADIALEVPTLDSTSLGIPYDLSNIKINLEGIQTEEGTDANMSLSFADKKIEGNIVVADDTMYLSKGIFSSLLELSELTDATFLEGVEEDYFSMETEVNALEAINFSETSKALTTFLKSYGSTVLSKSGGEYNLTINDDTLNKDITLFLKRLASKPESIITPLKGVLDAIEKDISDIEGLSDIDEVRTNITEIQKNIDELLSNEDKLKELREHAKNGVSDEFFESLNTLMERIKGTEIISSISKKCDTYTLKLNCKVVVEGDKLFALEMTETSKPTTNTIKVPESVVPFEDLFSSSASPYEGKEDNSFKPAESLEPFNDKSLKDTVSVVDVPSDGVLQRELSLCSDFDSIKKAHNNILKSIGGEWEESDSYTSDDNTSITSEKTLNEDIWAEYATLVGSVYSNGSYSVYWDSNPADIIDSEFIEVAKTLMGYDLTKNTDFMNLLAQAKEGKEVDDSVELDLGDVASCFISVCSDGDDWGFLSLSYTYYTFK